MSGSADEWDFQQKNEIWFHSYAQENPYSPAFRCESEHNVSILKNISLSFHLTPPIDKTTKELMELFLFPELFVPSQRVRFLEDGNKWTMIEQFVNFLLDL